MALLLVGHEAPAAELSVGSTSRASQRSAEPASRLIALRQVEPGPEREKGLIAMALDADLDELARSLALQSSTGSLDEDAAAALLALLLDEHEAILVRTLTLDRLHRAKIVLPLDATWSEIASRPDDVLAPRLSRQACEWARRLEPDSETRWCVTR